MQCYLKTYFHSWPANGSVLTPKTFDSNHLTILQHSFPLPPSPPQIKYHQLSLLCFEVFRSIFHSFLKSYISQLYNIDPFWLTSEAVITQSRIQNPVNDIRWSFSSKIYLPKTPSYMFDWVLNTPLSCILFLKSWKKGLTKCLPICIYPIILNLDLVINMMGNDNANSASYKVCYINLWCI